MRYCGREFTVQEIEIVRALIAEDSTRLRVHISRMVCEQLRWYKLDGNLKEMSCRVALLRMQADGLICLPPPQKSNGNKKPYNRRTTDAAPELPFSAKVKELTDLKLELVSSRRQSHLWNEYIDRYHYLGYKPLPGAQLRYTAIAQGRVLALLGFGAAAWTTMPRDSFIGWSPQQRRKNLHLIANNARFLILPWVSCKFLASKLLSLAAKRIPLDWENRYRYRPVLLETFVETRFRGTCYKAANWIHVGQTKGRGKLEKGHRPVLPKKEIFLFPLQKSFKRLLCS